MLARKIIAAIIAVTLAVLAWLNLFYQININTDSRKVKDLSSVIAVAKISEQVEIKVEKDLGCICKSKIFDD